MGKAVDLDWEALGLLFCSSTNELHTPLLLICLLELLCVLFPPPLKIACHPKLLPMKIWEIKMLKFWSKNLKQSFSRPSWKGYGGEALLLYGWPRYFNCDNAKKTGWFSPLTHSSWCVCLFRTFASFSHNFYTSSSVAFHNRYVITFCGDTEERLAIPVGLKL